MYNLTSQNPTLKMARHVFLELIKWSGRIVVVSALVLVLIAHLEPSRETIHTTTTTTTHHHHQRPPTRPTTPSPSCRAMFTIDKGHPDTIWDSDERYERLSRGVPSLLGELIEVGDSSATNTPAILANPGTRLTLMNGSIPYLPCKVKQFGRSEVGECSFTRASRSGATWITFVGDSNQRQKMHSFVSFLPKDLHYTYYLGKNEVNLQDFSNAVAHHDIRPPTFDIIGQRLSPTTTSHLPHQDIVSESMKLSPYHNTLTGGYKVDDSNYFRYFLHKKDEFVEPINASSKESTKPKRKEKIQALNTIIDEHIDPLLERDVPIQNYEIRVTLVWAPTGSEMGHPTPRAGLKVRKLHDLASAEIVPDIIFLGYGTWLMLMRELDEELVSFSELDLLTRPILEPLTALAKRTTVLYWLQSRYRWFSFETRGWSLLDRTKWWDKLIEYNQFNDTLSLLEQWTWRLLRRTGAWYWDSTLPLNLANHRECRRLNEAGLHTHNLYYDRWWNCFDVHHSSYATNNVEIQMILNLLCNKDLRVSKEYCCSGY